MRTNKFRGKRIDNGEWVVGSLLSIEDTCFIIEQVDFDFDYRTEAHAFWFDCTEKEVDPDTIGQFVGLCDKDGKEIYEGDIVRYQDTMGYSFVGLIGFDDGRFGFINKRGIGTLNKDGVYADGYCTVPYTITYEVIGNKFDNPELLPCPDR